MPKYRRFCLAFAGYLLALRLCPGLARWMLARASVPAMAFLHRLTAPVPFPVAEVLAFAAIVLMLSALSRAALRRSLRPLRAVFSSLVALLCALAIIWGPAVAVPAPRFPAPGDGALSRLCGELIDLLNASPLAFPDPAEALARAPAAAGLPDCAVKAARYPEWMAPAGAWGMFVPLTGEALADATAPAALIPFTAVHELMHLAGIADEGAANVAAWDRCAAAGGPFADSARLWALRYAMGRLRRQDPPAWQAARAAMKPALMHAFLSCGAEAAPDPIRRLSIIKGDYDSLAGYLCWSGSR